MPAKGTGKKQLAAKKKRQRALKTTGRAANRKGARKTGTMKGRGRGSTRRT